MNALDLVLACFLAYFSYRGFWKGLLREGCGLAGLILGVTAAVRYHSPLSEWSARYLHWPGLFLEILSFVFLFFACLFFFKAIGFILRRWIRIFLLSFWDQLGGALFGFLKGAAIAGFLILISGKVLPEGLLRRQFEDSFLIKPLGQLASFVMHTIEREHRGTPSQAAIG